MKTINLIFAALLFSASLLQAQEKVTLAQCHEWARENHPALKQLELYRQILDLKNESNATNYLPQVNLNGQASYQSDVPGLNISLPNFKVPGVDKDQYKLYLDFRQNIWDGGITKTRELVNNAEIDSKLRQTEVELYQVKERLNQFFFGSFLLNENIKILEKKAETLAERRKVIESAVRHGMLLSIELDRLLAELVKTGQLIDELKSNRESVLYALSVLTGKTNTQLAGLTLPELPVSADMPLKRPELDMFGSQTDMLSASAEMVKKQRNPKLFGFGQAGYGKPGLNMLNNQFDTYYLVGFGVSWNVFDWKNTARQQQMLQLQQDLVKTNRDDFVRNIDVAADQQQRQIDRLNGFLKTDRELIELRERITKTSASQLENGTATMADYIQELNAETTARITFESHKIQLGEAWIKLANIRGTGY